MLGVCWVGMETSSICAFLSCPYLTLHCSVPVIPTQDMAAHTYNLSRQVAEVRESEVQGRPWLYRKFKANLGYRRPCLKQGSREGRRKDALNKNSMIFSEDGKQGVRPSFEIYLIYKYTLLKVEN